MMTVYSLFAALALAGLVVLYLVLRLIGLRRRQDTLRRIMDSADELERDLHACRDRMVSMQQWVATLPSSLTRDALSSLNLAPLVQKALKDLLLRRLWLRDHGDIATLAQLKQSLNELDRSRRTLAEQMEKLEAAGRELVQASTETHPVSALMAGAYGIGQDRAAPDQTPHRQD